MINDVKTRDSRFEPYTEHKFKYFTMNEAPPFISSSYTRNHISSFDGGETWHTDSREILYGTYFFLFNKRGEH